MFWQWRRKICSKKWYVIDSESKGNYSHKNPIKVLTKSLGSSLCDYSDAYVLVTGNIAVVEVDANTKVAFKNCAPFRKCIAEINETFTDDAEHINITMPMYNLIEYSDNYSDTPGSLWQFKRDEIIGKINLTNNNSSSFKYRSNLVGNTDADWANRKKEGVKIVVPLKHLSNFRRSLEMPLSKDNAKLSKLLTEGFKRSAYLNQFKLIPE